MAGGGQLCDRRRCRSIVPLMPLRVRKSATDPMPFRRMRDVRAVTFAAGLAACVATWMCAGPAHAQEAAPQVVVQPGMPGPDQITGRGFQGVAWPLSAIAGKMRFAATTVYAWNDGGTQRLVLSDRVRITLGQYEFVAKKAAVFIEPAQQEPGAQQVYIYFEELGSPAEYAGATTIAARRLPVKAVVRPEGGVEIVADLNRAAAPSERASVQRQDAEFESRARAALAKSIRRQLYPELEPLPKAPERRRVERPARPPRRSGDDRQPIATLPERQTGERSTGDTRSTGQVRPGAQPRQDGQGERPGDPGKQQPAGVPGEGTPAPRPSEGERPPARPAGDPVAARSPLDDARGLVTLAPTELTLVQSEDESTLLASGGVTIQYTEASSGRTLTLRARRAVVFLDPAPLADRLRLGASQVRGVYLEGDVQAGDGQYTLRAPQIYYDLKANKAVSLDSVFWTYDEARGIPLYVRAKAIRQESATQFSAEKAVFTNSAFFDPELSLGASSVTISRVETPRPAEEGEPEGVQATRTTTYVDASNVTMRLMGLPLLWVPRYSGDPGRQVIRDFRVEQYQGSGAVKLTTDVYGLLGKRRRGDFTADLYTDYYFERGPALGTRLAWQQPNSEGALFAYSVIDDDGEDQFPSGVEKERDGGFRSIILGEQRWKLDESWTIFAEVAAISDHAFVPAYFRYLGQNRREFTNRVQARRLEDNTALSLEVSGSISSFLNNEYLLQSQGFSVNRTPDLFYARLADDLLGSSPGTMTWFSEYRATRMGLNFDEIAAEDRGLTTSELSQRALGIEPTQRLSDVLRSQGYFEEPVNRLDTRQEIAAVLDAGPIRFNPFVVGRLTFWDDEFEDYSPDENDQFRGWGAAGVRASTSFTRIYNDARSRLFDVHRVRHIIEPNVTLWAAGTNIESEDLPQYDRGVEGVSDGAAVKVGMTQYFQTQRGAAGRRRSVDLLVLSTDFVFADDEDDEGEASSPIGRWFDFRPEVSNLGSYFAGEAAWNVTDTTALTGSIVWDFDESEMAYGSAGALIRHSAVFQTYIDVRRIESEDSTLIGFGANYQLTSKYQIYVGASYDASKGGFQGESIEVRRRFRSFELGAAVAYDDITGETSFGFVLRPFGVTGEARFTGLGGPGGTGAGGF